MNESHQKPSVIHKYITIAAPKWRVFEFVEDLSRIPEWLFSLEDIRDIVGTGAEQRYRWTYRMGGVTLEGDAQVETYDPPNLLVRETHGGIESTWSYRLASEGSVTRLDLRIVFGIPTTVSERTQRWAALRQSEREAETSLHRLKEIVEHEMRTDHSAPNEALMSREVPPQRSGLAEGNWSPYETFDIG